MKTKKLTIKQALVQSLKNLGLYRFIKKMDEGEALEAFEKVCNYMDSHKGLRPKDLGDVDFESDDNGNGYTIGAQVADTFLEQLVGHLGIEIGDFGAEPFYEVGEGLWN